MLVLLCLKLGLLVELEDGEATSHSEMSVNSTRPQSNAFQKIVLFIDTATRTSNLTGEALFSQEWA
jgi:hypothetical protein